MKKILPLLVALVLVLASCQMKTPAAPAATEPAPPSQEPSAPPADEPSSPPPDEPSVEPSQPSGLPALPTDPLKVEFQAADGRNLLGYYYPAAVNPAPVVVFMHWVMGDASDWYELAPWLQNRGLVNPFPVPGGQPWWDPTWFPPVPRGLSYGVFIFSFRDCLPMNQRGCAGIHEAEWLLDAQAAILTAAGLDGVDPTRVVAIGSSIGADGAADACLFLNQQQPGACRGALSLSPGGYLTLPYSPVIQQLGQLDPPTAAWCLADESEVGLCKMADKVGNPAFQYFEIPSGGHGNMLLSPGLVPLPIQLILDFLAATVGP